MEIIDAISTSYKMGLIGSPLNIFGLILLLFTIFFFLRIRFNILDFILFLIFGFFRSFFFSCLLFNFHLCSMIGIKLILFSIEFSKSLGFLMLLTNNTIA